MKLFLLLTIALFTVAFCEFNFLPRQDLLELQDHRKIDDLRYFYTNLFQQFNLSEPEEIINCFNEKTAGLFFKSLYEFHQLLNDTKERNQFKLHFDWAKLVIIFKTLEEPHKCIASTKDFDNLLNALEVKERDPEILMQVEYIYYQARYAALLNDFVPLIKGLDSKDHRRAAIASSRVLSNMVETVNYRGLYWLANQAFGNGFAVRLELPNPSDSIRCYDNDGAAAWLEFLLKLSEVVSNGKWSEALVNTQFYWRDYGKDILKRIPEKTCECVGKSKDQELLTKKLGVDIYTEEFLDSMLSWINNNRLRYWLMMRGMKESFDHYNLNHVGNIYGHFIKRVAQSGGGDDSDINDEENQDIGI